MNAVSVRVQLDGEAVRTAVRPEPDGIDRWTRQQREAFLAEDADARTARAALDNGIKMLFDLVLRNAKARLGTPGQYNLTVTLEPVAVETDDE